MSERLSPQREAEIQAWLGRLGEKANPDWHGPHTAVQELLAELAAVRAERDEAREQLDSLERNTLPDLRRQIQHHQDGKKRWRDRAESAEKQGATS